MAFSNPTVVYDYTCTICGAPPTYRYLLKRFAFDDPDDNEVRAWTYSDYCNCFSRNRKHRYDCRSLQGYDPQLLPKEDIRWLGDVRLLGTEMVQDGEPFVDDDYSLIVSPIGDHVDPDMGTFHYQLNAEILQLHKDGVVAHDRCLDILKLVWKLPDKHHQGRPTDLGNLPLILCQGFSATELGFGNIFDKFDGERCDDVGIWNPVSASMWTVMDPNGPFDLQALFAQASLPPATDTESSFSFSFPTNLERTTSTQPSASILSLLPMEIHLQILDILPTPSVLNLLLASPNFRHFTNGKLPDSFWKSRLYFDMPWCADIVLEQVKQQRDAGVAVRYDQLFSLLKETSMPDESGTESEASSNIGFMALKNRRRIWRNCEMILERVRVSQR